MSNVVTKYVSPQVLIAYAYALAIVLLTPFTDLYLVARTEYEVFLIHVRFAGGTQVLLETAILLPISLFVSAILVPLGFTALYGANTSGWNPTIITFWQLFFPAITLIALAYQYIKVITHSK